MEIGYSTKKGKTSFWKKAMSFRETTLILIILAVAVIISILSPSFLTKSNLTTTAIGLSADGIIAIGMTVAIVLGGFDLSVPGSFALSGVITGILFLQGVNIWLACLIALAIGILIGFVNGIFIGKVGINAFIVTLGMNGIASGAAYVITQGSPLSLAGVSKSFLFIGSGSILGIPFMVLLFVLFTIFGDFMMRRSEPLRKVFYTGSNEKAAILSGINTQNVKIWVFTLVAAMATLAGIVNTSRFTVATPTAGVGADMRAISAAVIGGASLQGGEGTIFGSVLGVILLNLINNGLVLLNVSVYWQNLINGVILIAAVSFDYFSHKSKAKKVKAEN
jgi:ribose transport system permease protein